MNDADRFTPAARLFVIVVAAFASTGIVVTILFILNAFGIVETQ